MSVTLLEPSEKKILVGNAGRRTTERSTLVRKKKYGRGNLRERFFYDGQFVRSAVQWIFLCLVLWIGYDFYRFVRFFEMGQIPSISRPPGVEGFLPISALISLKYWIQTGFINEIHPSGLFILLAVVAVSWLLKKAFCSWICPVGFVSETLWMFGQKLFGKNLPVHRFLDWPLRSLKYLLLFFFAYAILQMDVESLRLFIYSPYNKVADIKMMNFFRNISTFAVGTILALSLLSVVIRNFWCRYLCPYGALAGWVSLFSPLKITRNPQNCIDCGKCTKACPSGLAVEKLIRVSSDECMACFACVDVCPVADTLHMETRTKKRIPGWVFAGLLIGVFSGITGTAMLTGHWRNAISHEEYQRRIQNINSPAYEHNRGQVPDYTDQD